MSVQDRLLAAIKAEDLAQVKSLIQEEKGDPNSIKIKEDEDDENSHFMYPLLFLATREPSENEGNKTQMEGSVPVSPLLEYLLTAVPGMKDQPDPDGATLLFYACCAGTAHLVEKLLGGAGGGGVSSDVVALPTKYKENGLDDNLSDKTPLAAAVERGDDESVSIAKILLRSGAERRPPAPHVLSALHFAVESDAKRDDNPASFPFLSLLLDNGWDVNLAGRTVWAPAGESDFDKSLLAQACFVDQYEDLGRAKAMLEFLLARGAKWNATLDLEGFKKYGRSAAAAEDGVAARPFALPIAFAKSDMEMKQKLLDAGCPDTIRPPLASDDGSDDSEFGEEDEEDDGSDESSDGEEEEEEDHAGTRRERSN